MANAASYAMRCSLARLDAKFQAIKAAKPRTALIAVDDAIDKLPPKRGALQKTCQKTGKKASKLPKLTAMLKRAERGGARKPDWERAHKSLKSATVKEDIGEKDVDVPEDGELPRNDDPLFGVPLW